MTSVCHFKTVGIELSLIVPEGTVGCAAARCSNTRWSSAGKFSKLRPIHAQ